MKQILGKNEEEVYKKSEILNEKSYFWVKLWEYLSVCVCVCDIKNSRILVVPSSSIFTCEEDVTGLYLFKNLTI